MSQAVRESVVAKLIFQNESQRTDLLNESLTQTELIALLEYLTNKGHHLEITAVLTDHHDDSGLNPNPPHVGTHAHGWAIDCWPLNTPTPGDYVDSSTHEFRQFLIDAAQGPCLYQIGLTEDAYTTININAAGPTVFEDDGGSHCHLGVSLSLSQ